MERQTMGRYQVRQLLGRGGMASVYLAFDPRFQREVAIKVLPRAFLNDPLFRARFQREAQTVAALEHPAIVPVHDFGEEDGRLYLVMAFMTGGSLADRLDEGPMSPADAARVLRRISSALDQAHKQGVVHRDLKPANILFDRYDNAYLSDFGIAKLAQATSNLTGDSVIGTPSYMSPEQARGNDDLDGRSDIYALGAILFTMLCGRVPYEAETPIAVLVKHIDAALPSLAPTMPDLAPYDPVIRKAMAKSPHERYATANELVLHLDRVLGDHAAAHAPGHVAAGTEAQNTLADRETEMAGSRFPVSPWLLALAGLFLVACIAGIVVGALALPTATEGPDRSGTATAAVSLLVAGLETTATESAGASVPPPDAEGSLPSSTTTPESATATPTATATGTSAATVTQPTPTPSPMATNEIRNGPIVFDSADDIFIMNADGSGRRQLTNSPARDDEADISSDGRFIAYETESGGNRVIVVIGIDGRNARELVPGRLPDWSPDDRFIAFESVTFPQQINVVEVATGEVRQITDTIGHSRAPSWSPDGEQIAFMMEVGSSWQLAVVDVDSGAHRQITTGGAAKRFPVWSPDGNLIAYNTLTPNGGIEHVWVVEPSGDNARRLTGEGQNGRPAWSPDSRYILFNSNRSGTWLVYRMDRDGSNQTALVTTGDAQRADWGRQWP